MIRYVPWGINLFRIGPVIMVVTMAITTIMENNSGEMTRVSKSRRSWFGQRLSCRCH
jgi:hypothetical protein